MVLPEEIETLPMCKVFQELVHECATVQFGRLITGVERAFCRARGDPIDYWIYHPDPWHLPPEEIERERLVAIRYAFRHHYEDCPGYRTLCDDARVTPGDIVTSEDLIKIPMIPQTFFKEHMLLSVPEEDIKAVVSTSGTSSGNPSRLPKDYLTLKRLGSISWRVFWTVFEDLRYVGLFAPPPSEVSLYMTIGNMAGPFLGYLTENYIHDEKFSPQQTFERWRYVKERGWTPVVLNSFHFFLKKMMDYSAETGERPPIRGSDISVVVPMGGWKRLKGEAVPKKEFQAMLANYFEIPLERVRDLWAFGECAILAGECKRHYMHIDPVCKMTIRDPHNPDEECEVEETGLVGVYDPATNSYPAFVISDDMARILDVECDCGLTAPIMEFMGRAPKSEQRSCGLKMEQTVEVVETKEMQERFDRLGAKIMYEDITH